MKISDQLAVSKIEPATSGKAQGREGSSTTKTPLFSAGQLIKAKVAGFTAEGKILLHVGGQTVTAETLVPLDLGSEVWLEVGKGGALPTLQLAAKKGAVHDFLKILISSSSSPLAHSKELSSLLLSLQSHFSAEEAVSSQTTNTTLAAASVAGHPQPEALKVLAMLLGQGGKIKIDLAETALKEGVVKHELQQVAQTAERLTKLMTAHQEINSQPAGPGTDNFLLFPCFFSADSGWGEWLFSMEKERESQEEHYSLAFFLQMSKLGPVSLKATISDKEIRGEFLLETDRARAHFSSHVPELSSILENLGYKPVSFSCRTNPANIMQQLKETLEEKAAIKRFSLLDVSV